MRVAYVDGRYLPHAAARVSIEDRGFQFADGVYEVIHREAGRLIDGDRHLDRLERSLGEVRIAAPIGRRALLTVLDEVARRNRLDRGLLYIQVTRGTARRDHVFPAPGTRPTLVVTMKSLPPYPARIEAWNATAITLRDERWARCDIKSVGLLANVLARQAARERGALEAILHDAEGMVTEGAATTVWIVGGDGVLRTPPFDRRVLPGCTRAAVIELATAAGEVTVEERFSVAALREAREIFLTGATSFVKPVLALDGSPVGDGRAGPVARRLFDLFSRHVHGNRAPA